MFPVETQAFMQQEKDTDNEKLLNVFCTETDFECCKFTQKEIMSKQMYN